MNIRNQSIPLFNRDKPQGVQDDLDGSYGKRDVNKTEGVAHLKNVPMSSGIALPVNHRQEVNHNLKIRDVKSVESKGRWLC